MGQPIRFALGMGAHDRLTEQQIAEAKSWAEQTRSTIADFHRPRPPAREWVAKDIAAAVLDHCYGPGAVTNDMIERAAEVVDA